jgi:hypothetical protein
MILCFNLYYRVGLIGDYIGDSIGNLKGSNLAPPT